MTDEPKQPPRDDDQADTASLSDLVRSQAAQIDQLIAALEAQGKMLARAFEPRAEVAASAPEATKLAGTPFGELWATYVTSLGERTWLKNMQSMMGPLLAHFAPSTVTYRPRYRSSPARKLVYGPDIAVQDLRVSHWTDFRVSTMGSKSATYRNLVLERFKAFLSWCEGEERISSNPLKKAKLEAKRPRRETTVSGEGARAIMAEEPNVYFQAIMIIAGRTGMRRDEVRCLKWSQIDMVSGRVHLSWTTTKSKKSRDVYLDPEVIALLHDMRTWTKEHRRDGVSDYLFPKPRKNLPLSKAWLGLAFREARDRAGIQAAPGDGKARFHDLRHGFASDYLERGGDIRTLQLILGHADLKTTELYVHSKGVEVRRGFRELHAAMRKPADSPDES
jgi:integrase